jgi:membrane protein implicated in regulation of membrane protease activity
MWFHSYTNMFSQASRTVAMSILTIGLLLIGFGVLILVLPEVFAALVAAVFFVVGFSFALAAGKMLWAQRRLSREPPAPYRQNVRIHHTEEHSDPFDF